MAITAHSSERLAKELDRIGQPALAAKARANQYHDFLSDSATPAMDLAAALAEIAPRSASAAELRKRVMNGEFDAPDDESDEWAGSEAGQKTLGELMDSGKKKNFRSPALQRLVDEVSAGVERPTGYNRTYHRHNR